MQKRISNAFTLIEILVALSIVAALAAFLSSAIIQSRNKARAAVCLSNMRQFATAFQLYRQDNDDAWPQRKEWLTRTIGHGLSPATSCPSARDAGPQIGDYPLGYGYKGYTYNSHIALGHLSSYLGPGHISDDSRLVYPSTTIALMDGPVAYNGESERYTITECPQFDCRFNYPNENSTYPAEMEKTWERHQGGANYLFCDGHAKWFHIGQVDQTFKGNDGKTPTFAIFPDRD
jgi:prepilin-type processing-associated H-X9-DG protein/prepilin-type N-terminal cleavage/methylation domain-containing protein